LIATFSERVAPVVPEGAVSRIARAYADSQSGGGDLVEGWPLCVNEKAATKSRGYHYLG
jgi:hypothetical protein